MHEKFYEKYRAAMLNLGFVPIEGKMQLAYMGAGLIHYTWASAIAGLKMMGIVNNVTEGMRFFEVQAPDVVDRQYHFRNPEMKKDVRADAMQKKMFLRFRREELKK